MKTFIAHVLYYTGHLVSKPMETFDWGWLYPIYNWLMCTSGDFDVNNKIWGLIDEHEDVRNCESRG